MAARSPPGPARLASRAAHRLARGPPAGLDRVGDATGEAKFADGATRLPPPGVRARAFRIAVSAAFRIASFAIAIASSARDSAAATARRASAGTARRRSADGDIRRGALAHLAVRAVANGVERRDEL